MKICIYGVGAIGGYIGALLAADTKNKHAVSAVARGATLAALREHGLRLQLGDKLLSAPVRAESDPAALGVQDLVVIAVKAPALQDVARHIAPLIGKDTVVLTAMNGVPWWFFDGFGGSYAGTALSTIDPGGGIAAAIPGSQVMGCVVHVTCTVAAPGLIRHGVGKRLIIGEPAGGDTQRLQKVATALRDAGFDAEISATSIQYDIWYKLWGNMTMNPVSAFTGAASDRVLDDPLVSRFCRDVMQEAAAIGKKIGCPIAQTPEDRQVVTRKLGSFKTSMLQDVEAGKAVEIDVLLTVVREIGEKAGVPTPNLDALLGLARLHARVHGLYPEAG